MRLITFRLPLLFILSLAISCTHIPSLKRPNKKSPPGTVRLTKYEILTPTNFKLIQGGREPLGFQIIETNNFILQLYLQGGSGALRVDVKKGDSIQIIFTNKTVLSITAVKDSPARGSRKPDWPDKYMNGYYELTKEMQQELLNKDVEAISMGGFFYYKLDATKIDYISRSLRLFH